MKNEQTSFLFFLKKNKIIIAIIEILRNEHYKSFLHEWLTKTGKDLQIKNIAKSTNDNIYSLYLKFFHTQIFPINSFTSLNVR